MTQKKYIVEGRTFHSQTEYEKASRDQILIDKLRKGSAHFTAKQLQQLLRQIQNGTVRFYTVLGEAYQKELEERIRALQKRGTQEKSNKQKEPIEKESAIDVYAKETIRKKERVRKWFVFLCTVLSIVCLGYFGLYTFYDYRTQSKYDKLTDLKNQPVEPPKEDIVVIHYLDEKEEEREILEEYKKIYNKNKKLIGWLKIDDTNIDYPVVQTSDNEYYLDHNLNQEYDKNGSIFMDKECDIRKPSTNLILYGHHMKNGQMFGKLDLYEKESYYKEHPIIQFDTIYEKGTYQVMYAFRSKVYNEEEILFKYYQFIDAISAQEYDSNMQQMASMALYDTGVTAQYGDNLLTLSTCDYQEKNGRFVVIAKKIKE